MNDDNAPTPWGEAIRRIDELTTRVGKQREDIVELRTLYRGAPTHHDLRSLEDRIATKLDKQSERIDGRIEERFADHERHAVVRDDALKESMAALSASIAADAQRESNTRKMITRWSLVAIALIIAIATTNGVPIWELVGGIIGL